MDGPIVDRLPATRELAVVALGDVVAIGLFVAAGELSHGNPISAGVGTFLSFVVGWSVAAVLLGAYTARALEPPLSAVIRAGITWTLAALVGQAVRAVALADANFSPTFVLVSIVFGGLLLVAWRLLAAVLVSRYLV